MLVSGQITFLPAKAAHRILRARRLAQSVGDIFQRDVANRVTELVIDGFEMVNVNNHARMRAITALRQRPLLPQTFHRRAPIG